MSTKSFHPEFSNINAFSLSLKDNLRSETNEYAVEDMTFAREEEVYSTSTMPESSVTEEKEPATNIMESKAETKRKLNDKTTEKKVCPLLIVVLYYFSKFPFFQFFA